MISRRRLIRFWIALALSLGMLALSLYGGRAPAPVAMEDFYLTPQLPPLPAPHPCDFFVTPIPPELVRRDSLRARVQSQLFNNLFSPDRPLYLVVVGHGWATELLNTRFNLALTGRREWTATLSADVRNVPDQLDPPVYHIGAIATLGQMPLGPYIFHVSLPCGGNEPLQVTFTIDVSLRTPRAPDRFLTEEEFLRAAIRKEQPEVLHYLVTHAIPASMGLPETLLVTTDPTGLWPKDAAAASSRACAWADQAWFADGVAALAKDSPDPAVRTWASFALAYLALDHPDYRARLLAASRGAHPFEAGRILAFRGDGAALDALLPLLDRPELAAGATAELATLAAKVRAARSAGSPPPFAATPGIWDALAARLRPGAERAAPTDTRRVLLELLGLFAADAASALGAVVPTLDELEGLGVLVAAETLSAATPRAGVLKAFRETPRLAVRVQAAHWANLGTGPVEAEAAAQVAAWLEDPATRHAAHAGRAFAQEAAILLRRHASAAEAPALAVALEDAAIDWPTRTAFGLVLARVAVTERRAALERYVEAARASGKTDVAGLQAALK